MVPVTLKPSDAVISMRATPEKVCVGCPAGAPTATACTGRAPGVAGGGAAQLAASRPPRTAAAARPRPVSGSGRVVFIIWKALLPDFGGVPRDTDGNHVATRPAREAERNGLRPGARPAAFERRCIPADRAVRRLHMPICALLMSWSVGRPDVRGRPAGTVQREACVTGCYRRRRRVASQRSPSRALNSATCAGSMKKKKRPIARCTRMRSTRKS